MPTTHTHKHTRETNTHTMRSSSSRLSPVVSGSSAAVSRHPAAPNAADRKKLVRTLRGGTGGRHVTHMRAHAERVGACGEGK